MAVRRWGKIDTLDLKILKEPKHQQALLLAELVALLHDVGKLSVPFIDQMSRTPSRAWPGFKHEKIDRIPGFVDAEFLEALQSEKYSRLVKWEQFIPSKKRIGKLLDLIVNHDSRSHSALLVQLINCCDGFDSGADKGTTRKDDFPKEVKQDRDHTYIATAFGGETQKLCLNELDDNRKKLTEHIGRAIPIPVSERSQIFRKVRFNFKNALAETRRAANDVSLWCHSYSVATLYKSALSGGLLGVKPEPDHLRWRILRINFDMLSLYTRAIKIADLLGYQKIVDDACERVKQLLEVEYPIGNEVYRDTTGIYFTFPDISLPAEFERVISDHVTGVDQELAPRIAITEGDGANALDQLKGILAKARVEARQALSQPFDSQNYSPYWQALWARQQEGQKWETCPICRLRPMGEGREACTICLERRGSRIKSWMKNPGGTIWMDEIADHNGRVALLAGKFGLDDWLSGEMVQTMLVKAEADSPADCRSKNPSPARLRRVWETCLRFWTETVGMKILDEHEYGKDAEQARLRYHRRLIVPDTKNGWKENVPYDGTVKGKPISLFWLTALNCFLTISNLQPIDELREGQEISVVDPDLSRKKMTFIAQRVQRPNGEIGGYKPFLPLLASPDQFLALVPAADALGIARKIREAYTLQFGKVQNRLPLFLGSVFFQRKMPLLAVIDTGRRMLDGWNPEDEEWRVERKNITDDEQTLKLHLARNGETIAYDIPIKMGDGTTEDIWYPYFRLVHSAANSRRFSFKKVREVEVSNGDENSGVEESDNEELWVHATDLRCSDKVFLRPSRFAYTFLEQTSQRFRFDPHQGMLLMDELPRLMEMWAKLKEMPEMTDTKLRGIQALFEAKLRLWGPDDGQAAGQNESQKPFQRLVKTTFRRERISDLEIEAVLNGGFQRCLEINLHILKQRIKKGGAR